MAQDLLSVVATKFSTPVRSTPCFEIHVIFYLEIVIFYFYFYLDLLRNTLKYPAGTDILEVYLNLVILVSGYLE